MHTQKKIVLLILFSAAQFQTLFSQIVLQGTVTDNGAEYLGNGAEPVANALVTVTDQAVSSRSFSSYTNEQGQYAIHINTTGVDDASAKPCNFFLLQNYPNPFNPSTLIGYEISQPAHVSIQVYSVLGRKVKTLFDGFQYSPGQVIWNGTDDEGKGVPAGVYIYSLAVNGSRIVRKMTLVDGHYNLRSIKSSPAAASATLGNNGLNKQAVHLYIIKITGEDIETYEQRDLNITGNLVLDASVIRTVTDIDRNIYRTVKIGDQWWMAENLRVTRYRNGEAIPHVTDSIQWVNLNTGGYCTYDNNGNNAEIYGRLYNWFAVKDSRNIAPVGWHMPTNEEWQITINFLGGDKVAGGKMKDTTLWNEPNIGATNESGFSALPGGYRFQDGNYLNMNFYALFWSSTEEYGSSNACDLQLSCYYSFISTSFVKKVDGFSVRCVKD